MTIVIGQNPATPTAPPSPPPTTSGFVQAPPASIPHFDLPLRFRGGRAVTVEQASLRDIQNCVETVLRTRPGEREAEPEFGVIDPTFDLIPANTDAIKVKVQEWEPRASLLLEEIPDAIDLLVDRINVRVSTREFDQ